MKITEKQAMILDNMDFKYLVYAIKNKYHFAEHEIKYEFEIYEQILGEMVEKGLK